LVEEKYVEFKPTFASEKLQEIDGISINPHINLTGSLQFIILGENLTRLLVKY